MQKTLVLHIGMHKTATTSIQVHLRERREQLRRMGVEFVPGLVKIARMIRNRAPMDAKSIRELQAHIEPLLAMPSQVILGSAEAFFGRFIAKPPVLINCEKCAADLRRILEPFDMNVQLFAAVRRQDTWLESAYQHSVKWNGELTFEEWFAELDLELLHWDRLLDGFAQQFGEDRLHVHPYERLFKPDGEGVRRLYRLFGAEQLADPSTFPRRNPSFSGRWLEVLRRANALIDREECRQLRYFMEQEFPGQPDEKPSYLNKELREGVVEYYSGSNLRLFDRYMPAGMENIYVKKAEAAPSTVHQSGRWKPLFDRVHAPQSLGTV